MLAIAAAPNLRLTGVVLGRFLVFVVLLGLSVPLSAELASTLPDVLPRIGIREGQFGWLADKYVLDLMVNWPLLTLAPVTLLGKLVGSLPEVGTVILSCIGWTPIAFVYTWGTRNRHLYFFVLSIYPFVWVMGVGFQLLAEAAAGI